jgi:hypothetical protein
MTDTKNPVIFIATPMYGGMATGAYTSSLMQVPLTFAQSKIGLLYAHMMNESLITRARNALVQDFLKYPEATHLMWIDADIGFNANDIISMVKKDVDIICGLYPKKEINWPRVSEAVRAGVADNELKKHVGAYVVNLVDNKAVTVDVNEISEISNGGTGFMLVKREVFLDLADKVPQYARDMYASTDVVTEPEYIKEFYATSIDEESGNRLLSEDYHFCKLARKNGYKIHMAPWVNLTHTGTYIFDGTLQRIE